MIIEKGTFNNVNKSKQNIVCDSNNMNIMGSLCSELFKGYEYKIE